MNKNVDIMINGVQIYTNKPTEDELQMYSLSDICRVLFPNVDPNEKINSWLRSRNTLDTIAGWEKQNNPNFDQDAFDSVLNSAGDNTFNISVSQWVSVTNAIGIKTTRGRKAGCHAVEFIVKKFVTDIRPDMSAVIEEQISKRDQLVGYRDACKQMYIRLMEIVQKHLIEDSDLCQQDQASIYAREADMLNMAVFGMRHSEWARMNPDKAHLNQRDFASEPTLHILNQMEAYAMSLVRQGIPYDERLTMYFQEVVDIKNSKSFSKILKKKGFDKDYPVFIKDK